MAGDSRFIWFPILLSCVFQVSDHRHVPGDAKIVVLKNPGVDNIFSKIPIILPDGIDPKNINVTSITLKTCTGVEERLTLLNSQLQQKTVRNRQLDNEAFGLRREVRMLKLQLAACSATASAVAGSYQTQLQSKMEQLLQRLDGDTFLMLELISVHSKIAETERLIGVLIEQSKTKSIDYQRQWMQKVNLLRKKVLQLNHDENNIDLTKEIFQLQTEMDNFRQLMLNAKNTTDTILEEQRVNLEVWKKQQENLQEQLQKADYAQAQR
ncbi:hypothetical protein E3U43_002618, partial [Larimichthys crocea]